MDESTTTTAEGLDLPKADLTQRSVNVLRRRDNGFVEFEFSVGWPELVVELMMTQPDFEQFCQRQQIPITTSIPHQTA